MVTRPIDRADTTTLMARIGFASRGLIYLLIGGFALAAAFRSGRPRGFVGVLHSIMRQPAGEFVVIALAAGLACFAGWLAISGADRAHRASDAKHWLFGAGMLADAVLYGCFVLYVLSLALGWRVTDDDRDVQAWTGWIFSFSTGRWLVFLIGIGLFVGGLSMITWSWFADPERHVALPSQSKNLTRPIARYGLTGRGAALALIGGYLVAAALDVDPSQAHGLGGLLQHLRHTSYGWVALPVLASAFLASAFFDFLQAGYRRRGS